MSTFWRALTLVLIAVLSVSAVLLGRWQLRRLDERRARNEVLVQAAALPPAVIGEVALDTMLGGRRVVARGEFDPGHQLLLRGRAHRAAPGLHVVTAFRTVAGERLWVLRGFVASPDGVTPPDSIPAPTAGVVEISGWAYPLPVTGDGGQPLGSGARRTLRRLDRAVAMDALAGSGPVYVMLTGDRAGPGQLPAAEPPVLDDGPHLSYAIQWFGIALAIAAFGIIVIRRGGRAPAPPRATP